ncbi:hypothetical protein F164LOC_21415 [Pectobacterium carotovorum]|nr:hypothetical protein F164LOC_21415 [Pectobacterium carotovorum]
MKLSIENLGTIKHGDFHINDLTIIFGKNNSGKTYISYATYILAKKIKESIAREVKIVDLTRMIPQESTASQVIISIDDYFKNITPSRLNKIINELLASGFCVSTDFFKKTKITFDINLIRNAALEITLEESIQHPLLTHIAFIRKESSSSSINITITPLPENKENTKEIDEENRKLINHYFYSQIHEYIVTSLCDLNITRPFIITSERTGVELFYPELDNNRSNIAEEFLRSNIRNKRNSFVRHIFEKNISKYSLPIADNIRAIRNGNLSDSSSDLSKSKNFAYLVNSLKKMTNGDFIRSENGNTTFAIKNKNNELEAEIPLQVASSSIKALSFIDLYINKLGHRDGTLIIDEPELNLHPDNQIIMAELIVRLVNSGIHVIMTTHSDYMVREINNRIKLNKIRKDKKLYSKYVENEIDIIAHDRISMFKINDNGFIEEIGTDANGMESVIFDDIIISTSEREDYINYDTGC